MGDRSAAQTGFETGDVTTDPNVKMSDRRSRELLITYPADRVLGPDAMQNCI